MCARQEKNTQSRALTEAPTGDDIVRFAVGRTREMVFQKNFVPWMLNPRRSKFEPDAPASNNSAISEVVLRQLKKDPEDITRKIDVDESYTLDISPTGEVKIEANTSIGLSHGLSSFSQLFYAHSSGEGVYTTVAPVHIVDHPLYTHRGFNLDVSRSYFPVKDIKKTIDALALTKANRFHIHIIDSQAWPLVVPSIPELSAKGAYQPSMVYTPEDVAEIQYYAALQGIQTIIEVEMPGHTASIAFSFPDMIAAFKNPEWAKYAAQPPTGTLKLNYEPARKLIDDILDDVLPRLKVHSSFFHTGGDEVNSNAYSLDETVKSSEPAVIKPFLQSFLDRAHDTVRKHGLTPIVWEEMVVDWNITFPSDVVVQTWKDSKSVLKSVNQGLRTIAGNYEYWYLDCGQGQWIDFTPESAPNFAPFADYCSPRKNWRHAYTYNPREGVPVEKHHLVIGGEGHLWAEQTDPVNLDKMLWPRLGAIQEVLWTGGVDPKTNKIRSQVEVSPRLAAFRERLVAMGVGSEPVHMVWCTMEGGCVL